MVAPDAPVALPDDADDAGWEALRAAWFPGDRVNLNPGTLGTPSVPVRAALDAFRARTAGYPLDAYVQGRVALRAARARAVALWGGEPAICGGTTQTMNLLGLLLPRVVARAPVRVWTTGHEHHGGVGGFEHDPAYVVTYLRADMRDDEVRDRLRAAPPDVLFVSQRAWTDGAALPVAAYVAAARDEAPGCLRIVDAAQSVGLEAPALGDADVVVASAHKWLHGPPGTGFAWVSARAREQIGALHRAGEPLDPDAALAGWEVAGGQDFALYAGVEAALALYAAVGPDRARARSEALAAFLADRLREALPGAAVDTVSAVVRLRPNGDPYPLYSALNARGVHTKCVKVTPPESAPLALLRLGVPWFETRARLAAVADLAGSLRA